MESIFLNKGDFIKCVESDGSTAYRLHNENGEGTITIYEVFPGRIFPDVWDMTARASLRSYSAG